MESNQLHPIIKTLDNAPRILFWSVDEFIVMFLPLFIGIFLGSLLVMALGIVAKPLYSKLKKRYPKSILRHLAYWTMPRKVFSHAGILKRVPPSHIRKYLL
jgi:type IV conjugative transfer system protein TraL